MILGAQIVRMTAKAKLALSSTKNNVLLFLLFLYK